MHMEDDFEIIDEVEEEIKTAAESSSTSTSHTQTNRTTQLIRNLVIKETNLTLSLSVNKILSF